MSNTTPRAVSGIKNGHFIDGLLLDVTLITDFLCLDLTKQ